MNYPEVIRTIRGEVDQLEQKASSLRQAIDALSVLSGGNHSTRTRARTGKRRPLSDQAIASIRKAQKARWAKWRKIHPKKAA